MASPVLLWGVETEERPALPSIGHDDFAGILEPLLGKYMVVAFIEDNMKTADFMCQMPTTGQLCYAFLSTVTPRTYYANVQQPLQVLRSLSGDHLNPLNELSLLDGPVDGVIGSINIFSFDKGKGSLTDRSEILKAHDTLMNRFGATALPAGCPVLYLYMSNETSSSALKSRLRRSDSNEKHLYVTDRLAFSCTKIIYKFDPCDRRELNITGVTTTTADSKILVEIATDVDIIKFTITKIGPYHVVKNFIVNGVAFYPENDINMPLKYSYVCGTVIARSGYNYLKFVGLQMQVIEKQERQANFKFKDPWDCSAMFSIGIVTGLLVAFLMVSITLCGIMWMWDIGRNDRFPSINDKPLNIEETAQIK